MIHQPRRRQTPCSAEPLRVQPRRERRTTIRKQHVPTPLGVLDPFCAVPMRHFPRVPPGDNPVFHAAWRKAWADLWKARMDAVMCRYGVKFEAVDNERLETLRASDPAMMMPYTLPGGGRLVALAHDAMGTVYLSQEVLQYGTANEHLVLLDAIWVCGAAAAPALRAVNHARLISDTLNGLS